MKTLQEKWDKKSQDYNRYTDDPQALEATICRLIAEVGIDFDGANVLDIGSGTGVYTLRVAHRASHIDAVDISPAMLALLREDAQHLGLDNITTHVDNWESHLLPPYPYDIAMATMFPALKEDAHFQKMHEAAQTKLFLGWGGKRGTELIEALFKSHGGTYRPPNSATVLKAWLKQQNYPYQCTEYTEEKIRIKPFRQAVENYSWHLKVRGMTPQTEKIETILSKYRNAQGEVVETTLNYLNLIVWH